MASFLFPSLHGYRKEWLSRDLVAGLTVWAVLVPEALAYATIAGVSPVVGLYAAPPALAFYALFGSSRHLVTGPMSATAALSATAVADVVTDSDPVAMTAALAITVGAVALAAGLLRLGFISNFVSEPVLKGFIVGMALTIIIGQVPKLLGVEGGDGNFFEKAWHVITELGDTSVTTLVVGLLSLALVLGLRRWMPVVPGSLAAVILGVIAVKLLSLDEHGVEIVGQIDAGLPSLRAPDVGFGDYGALAGAAVGVMFVGFAEGLGAAKTYAAKEHYEIDANRELLGLGAANLASGFARGMVVNGSLSKTAVNGSAGAKSQVSSLVVAVLGIVTLLVLTGLFEDLPEATLAAVVIAAVIELVDIRALDAMRRVYTPRLQQIYGAAARPDLIAAVATMLGVLVFDTLPGLAIGVGLSLALLVYRASRPHVAVLGVSPDTGRLVDVDREPAEPIPGVVVVRPETGLYFANAEAVRDRVRAQVAAARPRGVVLDAETIPSIDLTAVQVIEQLADDLERDGVRLVIARDVGQVRDVLEHAEGGGTTVVAGRTYRSVREAVEAVRPPDAPTEGE